MMYLSRGTSPGGEQDTAKRTRPHTEARRYRKVHYTHAEICHVSKIEGSRPRHATLDSTSLNPHAHVFSNAPLLRQPPSQILERLSQGSDRLHENLAREPPACRMGCWNETLSTSIGSIAASPINFLERHSFWVLVALFGAPWLPNTRIS